MWKSIDVIHSLTRYNNSMRLHNTLIILSIFFLVAIVAILYFWGAVLYAQI